MKMLSIKMIKKYDYKKTKEYVEDELYNLKILGTRLMCLLPPDAGRQISNNERVDGSITNGSKQEKYIEKKDYIEREIKKEFEKHKNSFDLFVEDEMVVFKEEFIYQNSYEEIEEKYGWSLEKIKHIKKSYMIKFALSKGVYYEK